jgi:micrococcal nuclease
MTPSRLTRAAAVLILGLTASVLSAAEAYDARVVHVADGDTVTVLRNGHDQVRIRLSGIDAPELHQDFGRQAKALMSQLVYGRAVRVSVRDHDRYGRTVARLDLDGQDVGLSMLRAGLAWHYTHYDSDPAYASAEAAARSQRAGLWADPHPIAPWDFRHNGGDTSPASSARTSASLVSSQPPALAGGSEGELHGNESSRVYHRPGCPNYNCHRCTRHFTTDTQARAAGFRPAGCCAASPLKRN